jgi:CheY-like chemotaxis protein
VHPSRATRPVILIVDDDRPVLNLMRRVLEPYYQVLSSENGRQALRVFEQGRVDLLLTDINMPVMNGLQLADAVRELVPHLPIAFVSASLDEIVTPLALARSSHLIRKPFDRRQLLDAVAACLRGLRGENVNNLSIVSS